MKTFSAPGHHAGVDDGWLSVQQTAEACGVTHQTIYRMVRRGELSAEKDDGRPYRLRRADVDAFIERSRVQPGELSHLLRPSRAIAPLEDAT